MTTIGGIGVGLFILLILWISTFIIFVICVKLQNNIGWVVLLISGIITFILLIIPLEGKRNQKDIHLTTDKDTTSLHKILVLSLTSLSALLGTIYLFVTHCIKPIRIKPIKSF